MMEIESQNMPAPGEGFAGQVTQIDAFKVFMRALPAWAKRHNSSMTITLVGTVEGLEINLSMPPTATPLMADEAIKMVADAERMSHLELLVDQMRNAGVGTEVLDPMIKEAEALAAQLFPRE